MDQCKHCVVRGQMEVCEKTPCTIHEAWYVELLKTRLAEAEAQRKLLTNLVDAAVLAIGEHNAPSDCYTPTTLTGNTVVCPACEFISMLEALAKLEEK